MAQQLGRVPVTTLSLPGRHGRRNFSIVSCLNDSPSVVEPCEDPFFGDMRWGAKHFDTSCGWKKRLVHKVYAPNGVYYHPITDRKVKIYTEKGAMDFVLLHNLYDPWFNPASNRVI